MNVGDSCHSSRGNWRTTLRHPQVEGGVKRHGCDVVDVKFTSDDLRGQNDSVTGDNLLNMKMKAVILKRATALCEGLSCV